MGYHDADPKPSPSAVAAANSLSLLATGAIPEKQADGTYAVAAETGTGSLARNRAPSLIGPVTLTSVNNASSDSAPYTGLTIDLTVNQTGTASGTTTALKVNLTETAVLGQTTLMDLMIGGVSRFRVLGTAPIQSASGAVFDAFKFASFTQLYKGNTRITALQSKVAILAPTLASDTATLTIDGAATVYIDGPPVAGTNVTLTAKAALKIGSGNVGIGADPYYPVHIAGASGTALAFQATSNGAGDFTGMRFKTTSVTSNSFFKGGLFYVSTADGSGRGNFVIAQNNVADNANVTTANAVVTITPAGNVGIGISPTAALTLKAVTATAGTAPLKMTAGTLLAAPEAGAIEDDGTHLYWTTAGGVRKQLDN